MSSWKHKPRRPIELGDDDVCFDNVLSSEFRPAPFSLSGERSSNSSYRHDPTQSTNKPPRTDAELEQLVLQHQSLIDKLLIELALEREARIALEDRVKLIEDTGARTVPPSRGVTRAHPGPVGTDGLSPPRRGWGRIVQEVPPS